MKESKIFDVSLRGLVMLVVLLAVVGISLLDASMTAYLLAKGMIENPPNLWIREPLYGLSYMVIGYYFGKQGSGKQQDQQTNGGS